MNAKNPLLSVFVMLTVVFASLALSEYYQIGNLTSPLVSRTRTTETVLNTNALMVSRACTYSAAGTLILTVGNGSSGKPIGSVPVQGCVPRNCLLFNCSNKPGNGAHE